MARYLQEFRKLHEALVGDANANVPDLLRDWTARHATVLTPLAELRRFNALDNSYQVKRNDLESLYALSRVCDTLILPFQAGQCWFDLSRQQFADFWQTLGVAASEPREYHSFWCEIVACENGADENELPRIEEIFWPALTWGDLLICRAGVRVVSGRNWMSADVAALSPLYFASRRNYRTAHDLSHGWGSNSQWGTEFRRDYVWDDRYIFNADGALNHKTAGFLQNLSGHEWAELSSGNHRFFASDRGDNEALSLAEREELLVNRCFVRTAKDDMDNFWPYNDVAVWKR